MLTEFKINELYQIPKGQVIHDIALGDVVLLAPIAAQCVHVETSDPTHRYVSKYSYLEFTKDSSTFVIQGNQLGNITKADQRIEIIDSLEY